MNQRIAERWIQQAEKLEAGEEILIEAYDMSQMKESVKSLRAAIKKLSNTDPVKAKRLSVFNRIREKRIWIIIRNNALPQNTAIKRDAQGNAVRISIEHEADRIRTIRLMLSDGFGADAIKDAMGELSDEEMKLLPT